MGDLTMELDLSIAADAVVSNALQLTRNLFCPYCADAYMFEFTLKDHLKKAHSKVLEKQFNTNDVDILSLSQQCIHNCPYCGAAFTQLGLVPKHISTYHGNELLKMWQQQTGNFEMVQAANENEPSILYAACSPGLSDIFDKMDTDDETDRRNTNEKSDADGSTPTLKSILKKTPNKTNRIIYSPATAAIRRSKSDAIKRSISVRRELRFDPNTKRSPVAIINSSPPLKTSKLFRFRNPFRGGSERNRQHINGKVTNQLITSTPINFLDDIEPLDANKKNWKATIRNNRPLFYGAERFQCAHCMKSWENNADLLMHLREHHTGLKRWLKPKYRCSLCGATFYSNNYLIRHCHLQHTPSKSTRNVR